MRAGGYKQQWQGADFNQSYRRDFKKGDGSFNNDKSSRQWRKTASYSFDEADAEHWFEALATANIISTLDAKYEVREEDKKGGNFCKYHQTKGHSTMDCYTLKGLIQKCFENGSAAYPSHNNDKRADAMVVGCVDNSQPTSSTCEDQDMVNDQPNGEGEVANPVYVRRHKMAAPSAIDDDVVAADIPLRSSSHASLPTSLAQVVEESQV